MGPNEYGRCNASTLLDDGGRNGAGAVFCHSNDAYRLVGGGGGGFGSTDDPTSSSASPNTTALFSQQSQQQYQLPYNRSNPPVAPHRSIAPGVSISPAAGLQMPSHPHNFPNVFNIEDKLSLHSNTMSSNNSNLQPPVPLPSKNTSGMFASGPTQPKLSSSIYMADNTQSGTGLPFNNLGLVIAKTILRNHRFLLKYLFPF